MDNIAWRSLAAAVLVGALAACSGVGWDEDPDTAPVALLTAPRPLVEALVDERDAAVVRVIGVDAAGDPNAVGERRGSTDRAVTRFEAVLDRHEGRWTAPYAEALSSLDDLARLRGEVDDHRGPATLAAMGDARAIAEDYDALVEELLGAHEQVVQAADDPHRWLGGQLLHDGLWQVHRLSQLRTLTVEQLDGGVVDDADELVALGELYGHLERGRAVVVELASGTDHETLADTLEEDLDATGYLDTVLETMETGRNDDPGGAVVEITSWVASWSRFLDGVEDGL